MRKRLGAGLLLFVGIVRPCSVFVWPPPLWTKNPQSSAALFRVVEDDRIGYIDAAGRMVIPAQFDNQSGGDDFSDGLVRVESDRRVSYVDDRGQVRFTAAYEMQYASFAEGLVQYYRREEAVGATDAGGCCRHLFGYLDRDGAVAIQAHFGEAQAFCEGLAAVREEAANFQLGRAGYIDRAGRWAIPAEFAMGGPFRDGLAVVVRDGQCQYGLEPPRQAAPAVRTRSSCGDNTDIQAGCLFGVIDRSGAFVVPPKYDFIGDYSDGLARFRMHDRWGFLDRTGRTAIEPRFEEARSFSGGAAAVRMGKKWGYVSRSGEWLVKPRYESAGEFSSDRAPVLMKSSWGFIDSSGAVVIPFQFAEATPFAKGLAHVRTGRDEYAWIRPDGVVVFRYIDKRRAI